MTLLTPDSMLNMWQKMTFIVHLRASHLLTGDVLQVFLHHDLSEAHLDQPLCALPLRGPVTHTMPSTLFA